MRGIRRHSRKASLRCTTGDTVAATEMKFFLLAVLFLSTTRSMDVTRKEREDERSARGKGFPWDQTRDYTNDFPPGRISWDSPSPADLPRVSLRRDSPSNAKNDNPYDCPYGGSCKFSANNNPLLQVSFDLRELLENPAKTLEEGCNSNECRRRNENMRIREPLYVEEPKWIQINRDNLDGFTRRFGKTDPFFGTRGKRDYYKTLNPHA